MTKTALFCLLMTAMPSALQSRLIPLKIGSFHQPMSENDLGRGFKLNVAQGEDSFRRKVFYGTLEIRPMTRSTTISSVIKDSKSLEESMEIGGRLAISYGPTISGEGSGNYLDKSVSSTRQVTVVYRSRHTAFFKRLQPGTLVSTQDSMEVISRPQELASNFGTLFVDTIVYGAQLDVAFTVTSTEDIDLQEIEAELKGKIGTGPLNIDFEAKFQKQEGQQTATYNMNIDAEATGVLVTIPANPTFAQVAEIIENFNVEYATKFEDFRIENIPLLEQIEPVGFMLSSTADRIQTLDKMEMAILEDRMDDLGRSFSDTMLWKAKLNSIDRNLKTRYESDHKLRVEMYNPYTLQQRSAMKALNDKINECLAFRASSLSVLVASNTTVPAAYPIVGSSDEGILRGLSGEYYLPEPVRIGEHDPLQDIFYIGFALLVGDRISPWMSGTLKRQDDGITTSLATAETPEDLHRKVSRTAAPTTYMVPRNVALLKPTSQSSLYPHGHGGDPEVAVDGDFSSWRQTHTNKEYKPWWKVDLQAEYTIQLIKVFNRESTNDSVPKRLNNFVLTIYKDGAEVEKYNHPGEAKRVTMIYFKGIRGDEVKIALPGTNYLSLAEVEVFALT